MCSSGVLKTLFRTICCELLKQTVAGVMSLCKYELSYSSRNLPKPLILKMIRYLDSIFSLYGLCQHQLVLYYQCINYYHWNNSSGLASTFYENLQVILRSISILQISKFEKLALKSFQHHYLQQDIKDLILKKIS